MQGAERRRALEALVAEVVEPMRRYLWRRTDEATADDVLGETLVVLWRRLDEVPDERVAWAIGVARLQLANAQRARRRQDALVQRVAAVDPPAWVDPPEQSETDEAVRRVIAGLRSADAEVLRLWAWEELEPREIATVLGITANAATVRLHRARKRFVAAFGKDPAIAGQVGVQGEETR